MTITEAAALIEADLLARFTQAAPRDRTIIAHVAELAADVASMNAHARAGIEEAWAAQLARSSDALLRGLYLLGSERIAGTQAECVLFQAIRITNDLATLQNAEGRA